MESFLSRRRNGTAGRVSGGKKIDVRRVYYLPSAIQMLARPAKARTEVNFMLTSWKQQERLTRVVKRLLGMLIVEIVPQQVVRCSDFIAT